MATTSTRPSLKNFRTPSLYSTSSGVQVPYVGAHKNPSGNVTINQPNIEYTNPLKDKQERPVSKRLLQYTGEGLTFEDDVIDEWAKVGKPHGASSVALDKRFFGTTKLILGAGKSKRASHTSLRKSNSKTSRQSNKWSTQTDSSKHKASKVTESSWYRTKTGGYVKSEVVDNHEELDASRPSSAKTIRGCMSQSKGAKSFVDGMSFRWDEAVLQSVSHETAAYLATNNNSVKVNERQRLEKMVNKLFGHKIEAATSNDKEVSVDDDPETKKKKLKAQNDQLKLERKKEKQANIRDDPLLKKTLAEYYNLPRFIKRQGRKGSDFADVNQTCQNIKIKKMQDAPTVVNLHEYFSSKIGKTLLDTDNDFEVKLLTGAGKQIHGKESNKIKMSDNSEFQLQLQGFYPQDRLECTGQQKNLERNLKGRLRWRSKPVMVNKYAGFKQPDNGDDSDVDLSMSGHLVDNQTLVYAVENWRKQWKMSERWHDLKIADIIIDLENIHDSVRFAAMAVCVVASLYSIPGGDDSFTAFGEAMRKQSAEKVWTETIDEIYNKQESDATIEKKDSRKNRNDQNVGHLPEILIERAKDKLTDGNKRVQLAASMCLHACGLGNDVTMQILEFHLKNGMNSDRVAAAQLIALRGEPKAQVVQQMIYLLLESDETDQASALLVHLSQYTRLVHSLLAEQLNNSNWNVRLMVCDILGNVKGEINRDLVNKLKKMMWLDWSSEVRRAAARVLGKTGHGRAIHYELRDKLSKGKDREVVEGLKTIAQIGIMTASLLAKFVQCFSSDYVSVRIEACLTAAKMGMKNETIIDELIRVITYDFSWRAKAHAIKAISDIGLATNEAVQSILWCAHFEEHPAVRLEACNALHQLMCNTPQVIKVLQERLFVEDDPLVLEEIRSCLKTFGVRTKNDENEMIRRIKLEVARCCDRKTTAEKILHDSQQREYAENKKRYVGSRQTTTRQTNEDSCATYTVSRPNSEINRAMNNKTPISSATYTISNYNGSTLSKLRRSSLVTFDDDLIEEEEEENEDEEFITHQDVTKEIKDEECEKPKQEE